MRSSNRWSRSFVAAVLLLLGAGAAWAEAPKEVAPACPRFNAAKLPDARGGVPYEAPLYDGVMLSEAVVPSPWGINFPPGLAIVDHRLRGTPTWPGAYTFSIKYVIDDNACPGFKYESAEPRRYSSTYVYDLIVHDIVPPKVTSFTVTPARLDAEGGRVAVTVRATDDVGVVKVRLTTLHPDGRLTTAVVPVVKGEWTMPVYLPANKATKAVTYRFTVTASDLDQNDAQAGPLTVTLGAAAAETRRFVPGG